MEVVASLSQGRTAAAQCGLFTYKSVPVIFEPPSTLPTLMMHGQTQIKFSSRWFEQVLTEFSFCQGIIQWRTCTTNRLVHTRSVCSNRNRILQSWRIRLQLSVITLLWLPVVTFRQYSVSLVDGRVRRLR